MKTFLCVVRRVLAVLLALIFALLADESRAFEGGDTSVRDTWSAYVSGGSAVLAEPENYITLR